MPMTDMTTKERILDAGEALIAAEGFDGATLRQVTSAAGVNLAAVNYHFGNKEGLLRAVLARRIGPINSERIAALDRLEARATPPTLAEVTQAFLLPMLAMHHDEKGRAFIRRLLGRFLTDQGAEWLPFFIEQFKEVKERFAAAFRACLPHLTPIEIVWRMHFAIGAAAHALADETRLEVISGGMCNARDSEVLMRELIQFIRGGLEAPSSVSEEGGAP